jgi:hypothetical protein
VRKSSQISKTSTSKYTPSSKHVKPFTTTSSAYPQNQFSSPRNSKPYDFKSSRKSPNFVKLHPTEKKNEKGPSPVMHNRFKSHGVNSSNIYKSEASFKKESKLASLTQMKKRKNREESPDINQNDLNSPKMGSRDQEGLKFKFKISGMGQDEQMDRLKSLQMRIDNLQKSYDEEQGNNAGMDSDVNTVEY